jgi:hypothetical protein
MKGEFFKCDCGCGGLHVVYDHPFGLELAHLVRNPYVRSWRDRFASAWAALQGKPYKDMVILNRAQMADLSEYISKALLETPDERHAENLERIEGFLFGWHCETSVDGIIKWAKSSDCSKRARERLKQSL